uniref:Uncharacterized protein TCIL3000_11_15120 n=1 Tax=Trypanosoma congolense (strain IL3000) TaxID=1068625 RepID=G0V2X2_TRYCI|nr:unnamed protein product [Trypanosoma congolense IL3000]
MSLLLDDEDYDYPPTKYARTEVGHTTPEVSTVSNDVRRDGVVKNDVSNKPSSPSGTTAVPISHRGGDGLQKMSLLAFREGTTRVNIVEGPTATPQRVTLLSASSQNSTPPAAHGHSQPATVTKVVFSDEVSPVEFVASATDVGFSGSASSASSQPEGVHSTLPGWANATGGEVLHKAGPIAVTDVDAGVKQQVPMASTPVAKDPVVEKAITAPRGQTNLSDFFSQMACTKKKV